MKISGIILMILMFVGIVLLIWVASRLILSHFKSDKYKGLKYDANVTMLMLLLMDSYLIKFFVAQYTRYRGMEYAAVILWTYIIVVIPYNLISGLVCGVKGKWILVSTLCGSIISSLIVILVADIF